MFSVSKVSVHFSGTYILDDVSFIINPRDRIGLVGKNGAGKTTLLRVFRGEVKPETGAIAIPAGASVGYLPQELKVRTDRRVFEEALTAFKRAIALQDEIQKLTVATAENQDYHSENYFRMLDRLNHANEEFALCGGHTMQAETEKVLLGLGFEPGDFNRPLSEFSGGWQMRVEIAKLLLAKPELILLDEPTNHLDIESIQWLEQFLINYAGAVVLVSHDRAFLDNITERTIEVSLGKIIDYKACYSDYVVMRQERIGQQMAAFSNQQRQIDQIERFVSRFRYKATKAKQVQSKLKMLEKIGRVEIDETDTSAIHFRFPPAPHSGKITIEASTLAKKYDEKLVFSDVSFVIAKGEKVAFVGRNGEGKTTLSRIIVGELEHEGNIAIGHHVKLGYFAQNQAELLDMEKTVFQTIDDAATGNVRPKIRTLLGSFLFDSEDVDKKVKVLSGGEKSRLALCLLLLKPLNLLVLDEPTNHLDMVSKDILKNALLQFDGTLIIVSHDRDFLQGLTNKVFEFRNQTVRQYPGDIYSFLDSRKLMTLRELEAAGQSSHSAKEQGASDNKMEYSRKKEFDRQLRKLTTRHKKLEEQIESVESEIGNTDRMLSDPQEYPELVQDENIYARYLALKEQLARLMNEWAHVADELAAMQKAR